jgi:hypothetical protein
MTVPVSKVKLLCTTSEVALVRASRKGKLERLDSAEVKQLALRARKLLEKWQSLGREQSRARNRKVGFGEVNTNTRLKEQIFREALAQFESRLTKAEAAAANLAKKTSPKKKKEWNAEHRATRAAVRKQLSAAERQLRAQSAEKKYRAAQSRATPMSSPKEGNPPARSAKQASKPRSVPRVVPMAKRPTSTKVTPSGSQRKLSGAAKKARLESSGKTTRMLGHIGSRGKRAQARRDSKK